MNATDPKETTMDYTMEEWMALTPEQRKQNIEAELEREATWNKAWDDKREEQLQSSAGAGMSHPAPAPQMSALWLQIDTIKHFTPNHMLAARVKRAWEMVEELGLPETHPAVLQLTDAINNH
jgi:hypothetical protein